MKVSKVEEQGLRLTLGLARGGGRCTLNELAAREQLSVALTAKILARLRRGGVVRSLRGRNGHYVLCSPASAVSVAQVLRALEPAVVRGCFNASSCGDERSSCPHGEDCSLRPVWRHIERQVEGVLGRITLQDLLREEGAVDQQVVHLLQARQPPAPTPEPAQSEVTAAAGEPLPQDKARGA